MSTTREEASALEDNTPILQESLKKAHLPCYLCMNLQPSHYSPWLRAVGVWRWCWQHINVHRLQSWKLMLVLTKTNAKYYLLTQESCLMCCCAMFVFSCWHLKSFMVMLQWGWSSGVKKKCKFMSVIWYATKNLLDATKLFQTSPNVFKQIFLPWSIGGVYPRSNRGMSQPIILMCMHAYICHATESNLPWHQNTCISLPWRPCTGVCASLYPFCMYTYTTWQN